MGADEGGAEGADGEQVNALASTVGSALSCEEGFIVIGTASVSSKTPSHSEGADGSFTTGTASTGTGFEEW